MKQLSIPANGYRVTARLNENPWNSPACAEVRVTIGHSGDTIHLRFEVAEKSCRATVTRHGDAVWEDSCVELFIAFDNSGYYNIECNCIGTIHAAWGENRQNRQLLAKELVRQITTVPSLGRQPLERLTPTTWSLELTIPVTTFCHTTLHSLTGITARGNLYKCGDRQQQQHLPAFLMSFLVSLFTT